MSHVTNTEEPCHQTFELILQVQIRRASGGVSCGACHVMSQVITHLNSQDNAI